MRRSVRGTPPPIARARRGVRRWSRTPRALRAAPPRSPPVPMSRMRSDRSGRHEVEHPCDERRLADRLPEADRQRPVLPGQVAEPRGHERAAIHRRHGSEHLGRHDAASCWMSARCEPVSGGERRSQRLAGRRAGVVGDQQRDAGAALAQRYAWAREPGRAGDRPRCCPARSWSRRAPGHGRARRRARRARRAAARCRWSIVGCRARRPGSCARTGSSAKMLVVTPEP